MTTWLLPPYSGATFQTATRNIIAATLGRPTPFNDSDVPAAIAEGWTYSDEAPIEQLGLLTGIPAALAFNNDGNIQGIINPVNGNTELINQNQKNFIRPKIAVFGNSIARQSCITHPAYAAVNTTVATAANAGDTSIVLTSATGFISGATISAQFYDGTMLLATQVGVPVVNTITISQPLKKSLKIGQVVNLYTTPAPSLLRLQYGSLSTALTMMNGRAEMIEGYGVSGGTGVRMLQDLARFLEESKPHYVYLHLFENDIVATSLNLLIGYARQAAKICFNAGAIPIFDVARPSSTFTGAPASATYDGIASYCSGQLLTDVPNTEFINLSTLYLDPAIPTNRTPLTGWTDGIHPNFNKQYDIATPIAQKLNTIIPDINFSCADGTLVANPLMTGITGTHNGGGTEIGTDVATSWTVTSNPGATTTVSKNGDGSQKIILTVPVCTATSQQYTFTQTYTLPTDSIINNKLKAFLKLRLNTVNFIDFVVVSIAFSTGETYTFGTGHTGLYTSAALPLNTILTLETQSVTIPRGATTCTISFNPTPITTGSPSVTFNADFYEFGTIATFDKSA